MDNPITQLGHLIDEKVDALETRLQIRLLRWGADGVEWLAGIAANAMRKKADEMEKKS